MEKLQIYSKQGRIIQLIIIALVFTSCAGRLDKPSNPSTVNPKQPNIQYNIIDFDSDKVAYNAAVDAAIVSGDFSKATILRDRMIHRIRTDIELNYHQYASDLFLIKTNIDFAADVATLGLAFATTITGGESAKTVLAAITTLFVGSRLSFDKNFFREKTTEIIITQMNASRGSINNQILSKMVNLDAKKYSFDEAYVELIGLFYAGTLQGGIQGLSAEAGKAASDEMEAAKAITNLRTLIPRTEAILQSRTALRTAFSALYNEWKPVKDDPAKAKVPLDKAKAALAELKVPLTENETGMKIFELLNAQITEGEGLNNEETIARLKKLNEAFKKAGIIQ